MEKLHYQNSLKELRSWEALTIDFSPKFETGGLLDIDMKQTMTYFLDLFPMIFSRKIGPFLSFLFLEVWSIWVIEMTTSSFLVSRSVGIPGLIIWVLREKMKGRKPDLFWRVRFFDVSSSLSLLLVHFEFPPCLFNARPCQGPGYLAHGNQTRGLVGNKFELPPTGLLGWVCGDLGWPIFLLGWLNVSCKDGMGPR